MNPEQPSSRRRPLLKILLVVASAVLLVLLSPIICRKWRVPLVSNGKVVGYATRPFAFPPFPFKDKENDYSVITGHSNRFTIRGDTFDFPLYIYPFADGERFLCVYDNDLDVLVFLVDFDRNRGSPSSDQMWPPGGPRGYLRGVMMEETGNILTDSNVLIRMPSMAEVQEVSSNLQGMSDGEFKSRSFPALDLGLIRLYWSKNRVVSTVATNRVAARPMK